MILLILLAVMGGGEPYLAACGRSPIPGAQENLVEPLAFERLQPPVLLPAPQGVVPWNEAHRYVDQTITVEGRIEHTRRISNLTFLNFSTDWRSKFYVVVFTDAHAPDFQPEEDYLHQQLRITGKVTLHKNRPQIQVHHLSQIEVHP